MQVSFSFQQMFCSLYLFPCWHNNHSDMDSRLIGSLPIIGEDIILESDVQNQKAYYINAGQTDDGTLKCQVMENMIISKLLYNKAKQDSLEDQ